ncbi:Phage terminase large subunit [compost metagenome]
MVGATTTYFKIGEMRKPWKIIQGGQGAGKNWAIAQHLLKLAMKKRRTITVVTDTFENLKDGIIKDMRDMFELNDMIFDNYYNASAKDLKIGKSVIQFRYVVGHKPQAGKSKRRHILYVNETTKIPWIAIKHYIARTSEACYFDLNPDCETWVHTEIEPSPRAEKIIVTHWDNEFCPKQEREFIESRKDDVEWYRVYGKGETGTYSDRRIYQFTMVNEIPASAKRMPSGMDFGVNPDPTFLVDEYIDGSNLYLQEVFRENNLMPEKITGAERFSIVDKMQEIGFEKNWQIGADSAGATEIKDMKKHGYNVFAVPKPAGSVIEGIKGLRTYKIHITMTSPNLKKDFERWFWKTLPDGTIVPEPEGHEPDGCAAARYGNMAMKLAPKKVKGRTSVN